ncbi:ribonuclease H-like domain-containing protein [Tanacetum coccineum]
MLSRYKARLVANGKIQQHCDETFSPVVKPATIRIVLSLAVSHQWPIHQLDVKNAFLHGHLTETVYMHQPLAVCEDSLLTLEQNLGLKNPSSGSTLYRSLAGALQYLTFTRPDLSYAVQQLCLYMHDPREPHFHAMKRVLRYLRGTTDLGLQLFRSSTSQLTAYSDADWAGCPATRRSTSGYCVFLGDNLLTWSSKRQETLSRSSAIG